MYLLFIDESGTAPPKPTQHGHFFTLGGVIIPENLWKPLAKKLSEIKRLFQVNDEIKWKYFSAGNTDPKNPLNHLPPEKRDQLRAAIFNELTARKGIVLLSATSHIEAMFQKPYVNSAQDLYNETYRALSVRFQYFLQDLSKKTGQDEWGMIIADHRSKGHDDRLRKHHQDMMLEGYPFSTPLANLVEGLFFAPSDRSVGIQLADLVAGAVHYAFERDNEKFVTMILPAFRKKPESSSPLGWGIVELPKTLSGRKQPAFLYPNQNRPSGGG